VIASSGPWAGRARLPRRSSLDPSGGAGFISRQSSELGERSSAKCSIARVICRVGTILSTAPHQKKWPAPLAVGLRRPALYQAFLLGSAQTRIASRRFTYTAALITLFRGGVLRVD
jgi:hypothetical protein